MALAIIVVGYLVCKHWNARTLRQQNFIIFSTFFVITIFALQISGDNYYYSKNGPLLVFSLCINNFYILGLQILYKNSEKSNLLDRPITFVNNSIQDVDQGAITSDRIPDVDPINNSMDIGHEGIYMTEEAEDSKVDVEFEIGSDQYDEVEIVDQGDYSEDDQESPDEENKEGESSEEEQENQQVQEQGPQSDVSQVPRTAEAFGDDDDFAF